jgi:hypothetical protein
MLNLRLLNPESTDSMTAKIQMALPGMGAQSCPPWRMKQAWTTTVSVLTLAEGSEEDLLSFLNTL